MDADEDKIKVKKIERGIVIDHLKGGTALQALSLLGINKNFPGTVSMVMNVPSQKLGFKDIIKIEGKKIEKEEIKKIASISPNATVNVINNYAIIEKYRVKTSNTNLQESQ
ncbi:MAG: aspartate carbamoyltransferase regulatory subunit [Candidatus Micrarchaeia archaeon]